jgi:metal-responsive CopG/Arc/MetJ family transcriptional regulator
VHPVHVFLRASKTMARTKMGVSIRTELVDELDSLVDECSDLGASRSEIVEAILTAYFQNDEDQIKQTRELIIRNRKRSNS